MDLFLIDVLLKEKIPDKASVLDVGCGDGRNGIYFIRRGYEYLGIDKNDARVKLIEYLSNSLETSKALFQVCELKNLRIQKKFNFIICSRMLHFAEDEADFFLMWEKITELMEKNGVVYVSMDSAVENTLAIEMTEGLFEFPDGKVRFALTDILYEKMKKGFEEVEPLKTLVHHTQRAQSFMLLKKI